MGNTPCTAQHQARPCALRGVVEGWLSREFASCTSPAGQQQKDLPCEGRVLPRLGLRALS
ncbi:hypothetical protein PIB30_116318, partial [Stylosanthes scabra]|nr:hypothetical protein [Stylosanthes scabra]